MNLRQDKPLFIKQFHRTQRMRKVRAEEVAYYNFCTCIAKSLPGITALFLIFIR